MKEMKVTDLEANLIRQVRNAMRSGGYDPNEDWMGMMAQIGIIKPGEDATGKDYSVMCVNSWGAIVLEPTLDQPELCECLMRAMAARAADDAKKVDDLVPPEGKRDVVTVDSNLGHEESKAMSESVLAKIEGRMQ